MTNREEYAYFIEQLAGNAQKAYRATGEAAHARERRERMERECECRLNEDERAFVARCFEQLEDDMARELPFVYRQGLLDGIELLKWLKAPA